MPTLSFDGETHDEIVQKVRRWLASIDGDPLARVGVVDVVNQSAELTKDALQVVAQSAPGGIGESDLMKALTTMGYKATDQTRETAVTALDAVDTIRNRRIALQASTGGTKAVFPMNAAVAKQILKGLSKE